MFQEVLSLKLFWKISEEDNPKKQKQENNKNKMGKNIELDLQKDILEGWEKFYDALNVKLLRIARSLGHQFPPVNVVFENGVYQLEFSFGNFEGGHSRAVLALQENYPLKCTIIPRHLSDIEDGWGNVFRRIQDIPPERKTDRYALERLNRNLGFLPYDIRQQFIEENSLIILGDGKLADRGSFSR